MGLFVLVLATSADADTWTVDPTPGVGDFTTIQLAINVAKAGDTIRVNSGIYKENVNVNKQLTLQGVSASVVDAGGSGDAITLSANGCTLQDLVAMNSSFVQSGIEYYLATISSAGTPPPATAGASTSITTPPMPMATQSLATPPTATSTASTLRTPPATTSIATLLTATMSASTSLPPWQHHLGQHRHLQLRRHPHLSRQQRQHHLGQHRQRQLLRRHPPIFLQQHHLSQHLGLRLVQWS